MDEANSIAWSAPYPNARQEAYNHTTNVAISDILPLFKMLVKWKLKMTVSHWKKIVGLGKTTGDERYYRTIDAIGIKMRELIREDGKARAKGEK